jgi:Tol biopolymer transport system component
MGEIGSPITMSKVVRNPIIIAIILFLTGLAAVLMLRFRAEAEVESGQIVYIGQVSALDSNLFLHNPGTGEASQLTETDYGVEDVAIAPDGLAIAYSRYNADGTTDIWLYDLRSGEDFRLTDCVNASCGQPSWRADGQSIAFTRSEFDDSQRVWRVNPTTTETQLLFDDPYITGHSPQYAPQGNRITMFATHPVGILIYDFTTRFRENIQSRQGSSGNFSPDGQHLSYPILVRGAIGATFFSQLETVELQSDSHTAVTGTPDDPIEDVAGFWRPGHADEMAVMRRFLDDRFTEGYQVYLLNVTSPEARPLIVDADFTHSRLKWSSDGQQLLVQRFALADLDGSPEIWLYDMQTGDLQLIAEDAIGADFLP